MTPRLSGVGVEEYDHCYSAAAREDVIEGTSDGSLFEEGRRLLGPLSRR